MKTLRRASQGSNCTDSYKKECKLLTKVHDKCSEQRCT